MLLLLLLNVPVHITIW